jgi:hypothetical protein
MVLNATFNDISDILWRSLLLVSEKGVTGEHQQPAAIQRKTLSHIEYTSPPETDSNSQR